MSAKIFTFRLDEKDSGEDSINEFLSYLSEQNLEVTHITQSQSRFSHKNGCAVVTVMIFYK